MWLATKLGFYSIVKKDGGWHVRARAKKDLVALRREMGGEIGKLPIFMTPKADYCCRLFIPEEKAVLLAALFIGLGTGIDYGNFKSKVGATKGQRDKLGAYHDIWGVMMDYQMHGDRPPLPSIPFDWIGISEDGYEQALRGLGGGH